MRIVNVLTGSLLISLLPLAASDGITSQQANDILSELRKIRMLLEANGSNRGGDAPPTRITLSTKGAPSLGSENAPLTIVEFMDYQCPYCRQFQAQTFQEIKKIYIDSGKVRFYVMDFPLDIHPQALLAAQGGRCAAEQTKFWPMHDRMQSEREALTSDKILALAGESGLDVGRFRDCLEGGKYKSVVQQAVTEAAGRGIRATPTFVVGKSTKEGVEGDVILGAVPLGVFQKKLEALTE
jgi:protein-disulfide isomerase